MSRRKAATAQAGWTDALALELDRRIARQVAALRGGAANPALTGLVITDAEVDALLRRDGEADAGEPAGSLADAVARCAGGPCAPLLALRDAFGLQAFDLDAVLACLATEIDARFERLYAYLNDDLGRPHPSADVLTRLLAPRPERLALKARLAPDAPLLRWRLLVTEEGARPGRGEYRVADGVVRRLLGRGGDDAQVAKLRHDEAAAPLAPLLWARRAEGGALAARLRALAPGMPALVVNVHGRSGSGRAFVVRSACRSAGLGCLALDGRRLRRSPDPQAALVGALRDARLEGSALFLHHADQCGDEADRQAELREALHAWLRELGGIVLLGSDAPLPLACAFPTADTLELGLPPPDVAARESAWIQVLDAASPLDPAQRAATARELAVKFRMTQGEIAEVAQQLRSAALGVVDPPAWSRLLHERIGRVAAPRLRELAEPMPLSHTLDDMVLPPDRHEVLLDVVRRVRHRRTVFEDWGFQDVSSRGRGLVALFHGASGTGKTMAAEAIARALQMQLFRIDLAGVVSKYIGETEKNLRAIFDEADRADAVLFFDEADALFGRRSEVKDAHDRYANIEINYLLQRIELFDGIAILATNKRGQIDEAFLRRIHLTLEFPVPRPEERLRLWDRSFPAHAPLSADLDWDFLAQRFDLTGGAIRNAALGAAFLAAEAGCPIGMGEVVKAVRTELVKLGRRVQDSEFAPYDRLLALPAPPAAHARRERARRDRLPALVED